MRKIEYNACEDMHLHGKCYAFAKKITSARARAHTYTSRNAAAECGSQKTPVVVVVVVLEGASSNTLRGYAAIQGFAAGERGHY